ncbi:MAG TPA: response regulator transcription factor [Pseudonocardiaceae bacterium]
MTIRVLIADDHPVIREGLRAVLGAEPDLEVVATAATGTEAVTMTLAVAPDVVLMDLRMPDLNGTAATTRIVANSDARVVVLTAFDTDGDILRAVEAGATGYLLKDAAPAQLIDAVRTAARGGTVLATPIAAKLVTAVRAPTLTPREHDVLTCVADGLTNAQAARRLHISEATVKTHLLRVYAKLNVTDRTAATTAALARGLLPPL